MRAVFDVGHGQTNWAQTGFSQRTIEGTFSGFASMLLGLGFSCSELEPGLVELTDSDLLVIPPPTGVFNQGIPEWEPLHSSCFKDAEIQAILDYVRGGGHLLAFSYRFGDSFTKTNLRELLFPLGCLLNETSVINPESFVLGSHPLSVSFETPQSCLPMLDNSSEDEPSVHWRSMTTLSIREESSVLPLAITPSGCVGFDHRSFRLFHKPQIIGAGGTYGKGKFAVFGGPHAFETGGYGLLDKGDNLRFSKRLLRWLFYHDSNSMDCRFAEEHCGAQKEVSSTLKLLWNGVEQCTKPQTKGALLVTFVDALFQDTAIMKPVGRSIWNLKRTSELDLVYQVHSQEPVWSETNGLLSVECKNWDKPVGSEEIVRFADKVGQAGSRIGFFAARSFTRQAWMTVEQIRLSRDIVVGLLSDEDYRSFLSGSVASRALIESSLLRSMLL